MSYIPTAWQTGDELTVALMNKMERGLAGSDLFIIESTCEEDTQFDRDILTLTTPVEDIVGIINNDSIIAYQIMTNLDNDQILVAPVVYINEGQYNGEDYVIINDYAYNETNGIGYQGHQHLQ